MVGSYWIDDGYDCPGACSRLHFILDMWPLIGAVLLLKTNIVALENSDCSVIETWAKFVLLARDGVSSIAVYANKIHSPVYWCVRWMKFDVLFGCYVKAITMLPQNFVLVSLFNFIALCGWVVLLLNWFDEITLGNSHLSV